MAFSGEMRMATNPYSPENVADLPESKPFFPRRAVEWLVVLGILGLLFMLVFPVGRMGGGAREAARRMSCSNNLHNIALALQQYETKYGALPPAYTVDAEGQRLHSWRTLILPFLEQKNLYDKIDLSKPWDDPANRSAYEVPLKIYACPSSEVRATPTTTYFAIVVPGGCFKSIEPRLLADITDSKDLTLMVLEVPEEHAVHWMEPRDADEALLSKLRIGESAHPSGTDAVCVSGAVRFLADDSSPAQLRALISIAGDDDEILRDF
jgi:hypothetical protein